MPEAVLTLKLNPKTGERTLIINYESDSDAMSYEHEDDHRTFVESILGKSLHEVADKIEINRAPPHPMISSPNQPLETGDRTEAQDQVVKQKQ